MFSLAASVFVYIVLFMRVLENIQSWADFKVPIGLNMIWAELGPGMDALLAAISHTPSSRAVGGGRRA